MLWNFSLLGLFQSFYYFFILFYRPGKHLVPPRRKHQWHYGTANWDGMRQYIQDIPWNDYSSLAGVLLSVMNAIRGWSPRVGRYIFHTLLILLSTIGRRLSDDSDAIIQIILVLCISLSGIMPNLFSDYLNNCPSVPKAKTFPNLPPPSYSSTVQKSLI